MTTIEVTGIDQLVARLDAMPARVRHWSDVGPAAQPALSITYADCQKFAMQSSY